MSTRDDHGLDITPEVLLKAYSCGIFPMAENAHGSSLYWLEPEFRGVLPLDAMHVPRRLARTIRQGGFEVRVDNDFDGVIYNCAAPKPGRRSTWINAGIRKLYRSLFDMGHCHTIEIWRDGRLVGGLYGVHLGRAFFGESMFSLERDASKIALVHLVARLRHGGFTLLDTQFLTDHLSGFGAIEVPRAKFQRMLESSLSGSGEFSSLSAGAGGDSILQLVSQTSKTGCSTA